MSTALKLIHSVPPLASSAEHAWEPGNEAARDPASEGQRAWSLLQLSGRLAELSTVRGGAQLTFAFRLVLDAQKSGETSAWIGPRASTFFPPDAEACGIDLLALPVLLLEEAQERGRAADQLLRSGAFGLLVIDLGSAQLAAPLLTRLLGLAQKHSAAVLFLTEKPSETASLSSLISLRAEVLRTRREPGQFICELRALKDKKRAPGWTHREEFRGPAGLR